MDDLGSVGARVRQARRAKGITEAQLASRVGKLASWVRGVEQDRVVLDKYSILGPVAETLQVDLGWLLGQPYRPDDPSQEAGQSAVPALREALRSTSVILSGHPGLRARSIPLPLTQLRADVDRLRARQQAAEPLEVMHALPELVEALNTGTLDTIGEPDNDAVLGLVVEANHVARAALNQLGFHDLAWTAAANAAVAAQQLDDLVFQACNAWNRCGAMLHTGSWNAVIAVAEAAMADLEDALTDPTAEIMSLYGALNLRCAVASARRQDFRSARQYLSEAQEAATRLGQDRNDHQTAFGPANVTIHATEIAVELDQPELAVQLCHSLDTRTIPFKERAARQDINAARAYTQLERYPDAIASLQTAADTAPHYTFNDPMARAVVTHLTRQANLKVSFQLSRNPH